MKKKNKLSNKAKNLIQNKKKDVTRKNKNSLSKRRTKNRKNSLSKRRNKNRKNKKQKTINTKKPQKGGSNQPSQAANPIPIPAPRPLSSLGTKTKEPQENETPLAPRPAPRPTTPAEVPEIIYTNQESGNAYKHITFYSHCQNQFIDSKNLHLWKIEDRKELINISNLVSPEETMKELSCTDIHKKDGFKEKFVAFLGDQFNKLIAKGTYNCVYQIDEENVIRITNCDEEMKISDVVLKSEIKGLYYQCFLSRDHPDLFCNVRDFGFCSTNKILHGLKCKYNVYGFQEKMDRDLFEYLYPQDLSNYFNIEKLKLILKITENLLEILKKLHEQKIVHLDLKEENIMMVNSNAQDINDKAKIKLTDFGNAEKQSTFLKSGYVVGTTGFLSKNFYIDSSGKEIEITPQFDLHSYGVIVCQMLVAKDPVSILKPGQLLQDRTPLYYECPREELKTTLSDLLIQFYNGMKMDNDDFFYSYDEFMTHHKKEGPIKWRQAMEGRKDPVDDQYYTHADFVAHYREQGDEKWRQAVPIDVDLLSNDLIKFLDQIFNVPDITAETLLTTDFIKNISENNYFL